MADALRVALVHDALVNTGGAERVLVFMRRAFPDAPIFTSAYLPDRTYPEFRTADIRTTALQRIVGSEAGLKRLALAVPFAFRSLDLRGYDVVVSSSTFGAKAVSVPPPRVHACYCYAPFRLLWSTGSYLAGDGAGHATTARLARTALAPARAIDRAITRRISRIATTCRNMSRQLETVYGVTAQTIYAPIDCDRYHASPTVEDFYLVVSRLMRHKRIDIAIDACAALGRRLVIVGEGPARAELERMAGPRVRFLGRQTDEAIRQLYAECRALLFPSDEDYGLVPLEVQASGRPVVALGRGGALETVIDGVTGVLVPEQTAESFAEGMRRADVLTIDPVVLQAHARAFDVAPFAAALRAWALSPRETPRGD